MQCFTTFTLDLLPHHENLRLVLLYILPHLPNLHRLVLPDHLNSLEVNSHLTSDPSAECLSSVLAKLDKFARKITEWDVSLPYGQPYESLVFTNPSAIRSLTTQAEREEGDRLLGPEDSTFCHQLARCSSLETLRLTFRNTAFSLPYIICDPYSLSLPYTFLHTLTSLELSVKVGPGPALENNDVSLLQFAAIFPNLQHLCLKGIDYSNAGRVPLDFPRLVHLEPLSMRTPYAVVPFLEGNNMPKLERLEIGIMFNFDLAVCISQFDTLDRIAEAINRTLPNLTLLELHHRSGLFETDLIDFKESVNCTVRSSWRAGEPEKLHPYEAKGTYDGEDAMFGLSKAVSDLADWTKETADKLFRQGDIIGMRELWEEQTGLQEYRKWMEE